MVTQVMDLELQLALIRKLEAERDELNDRVEALKDGVKELMKSQGVEQLRAGVYSVSWKSTLTHRFDSQQFKADHAELYEEYSKPMEVRRFLVR